ncbi:hypothetical protein RI065_04015 [Mycoplasmatota bacterium zrk1]
MKRMLLGTMLFFGGLIGILSLTSHYNKILIAPDTVNYQSFYIFLSGEGFTNLYNWFIIIAVIGFLICLFESYKGCFIKKRYKNK